MSVDIVHFRAANIKTITPMLEGLEALWSTWTHSEKKFRLREIIRVKYYRTKIHVVYLHLQ